MNKRKTKTTAGEWWFIIMLYAILFGGTAYLGCTQGSEPAYAYPDFHATSVLVKPSPNKTYKNVTVNDDTSYSGLHSHSLRNTKVNRFMNNMYSHPVTHGVASLIKGNGYDTSYDTGSEYNDKMYKPTMVSNPEAGASYISKKGMPINKMIANHKRYKNNVINKAHKILKSDRKG